MRLSSDIPRDRDGQYCLSCLAPGVQPVARDGRTYYRCAACGETLERSLVIDGAIKWWTDADGTYWHESVGIVAVAGGKTLTFLRRLFPFGHTIPAGHVDAGEPPLAAALRELHEETGIVASDLELVAEFDFPGDSCRRGCDHHRWHLYRLRLEAVPEVDASGEGSEVAWMTPEELRAKPNLTPALRHFVDAFGRELFE